MAGQSSWGNAGDANNAYVVRSGLEKEIYYKATYRTFWGKSNEGRTVTTEEIEYGKGQKMIVDKGNNSIVWEKDRGSGTNETRFTLRERKKGMATYGEAPVKPGAFSEYKHCNVFVIQVDSPAYPIIGTESEFQVSEVIDNIVEVEKDDITLWAAEEMDLDGWRGMFLGASRGLLSTEDGAMGIALAGGTAGQARAPYNNYVEGGSSLVTPSATLATHNTNLYNALATLANDDAFAFTYESHRKASKMIEDLYFKPTSVGGQEYRAACAIDRRLLDRLTAVGGTLETLFRDARERGSKNPALNHLEAMILDDILYIPVRQLEFFCPTLAGGVITFGAGLNRDPRSANFSNVSGIRPAVYMGAGAMLRALRKKVWWTTKEGDHMKGKEYSTHYYDGWKRHDWEAKDGRTEMSNDSSLVYWAYDPGFQTAFAA